MKNSKIRFTYPLFETFKVVDGIFQNIYWHQKRYCSSYNTFYNKRTNKHILENVVVPNNFLKGNIKAKILYNDVNKIVKYSIYENKCIRNLKIVRDSKINYSLKWSDRTYLDYLYKFRSPYDDILIIKNEFVSDSSFCNIVFFDGKDWITPSTPLLSGTARAKLLSKQIIKEKLLKEKDICQFQSFKLINAMKDFFTAEEIPVSHIYY